jgi:iron complex outermembrane receptor protein
MDNYSLRQPPNMPMVSYPDRTTQGAWIGAGLVPMDQVLLTTGVDFATNEHTSNMQSGMQAFNYRQVPREKNADFERVGVFAEWDQSLNAHQQVVAGLRLDRSDVTAQKEDGYGGAAVGTEDDDTLTSGFVRFVQRLESSPATVYAGVGRAERAADFWERNRVFALENEALTQADVGASWQAQRMRINLALFYGQFDDYILIGGEEQARNIDASHFGGELDMQFKLTDSLSTQAAIAWVRAENDTDNKPLAQTPPLKASISLDYVHEQWFAGALLQVSARQDRIHTGYGTIYSLDAATETPGYGVTSAYLGYQWQSGLTLVSGVDNLFDRQYAEHIQKGAAELGATQERIDEPGRNIWVKLASRF